MYYKEKQLSLDRVGLQSNFRKLLGAYGFNSVDDLFRVNNDVLIIIEKCVQENSFYGMVDFTFEKD